MLYHLLETLTRIADHVDRHENRRGADGRVGEEEILRVAARGLIKVGHPRPANGRTSRLPDNFDKCCPLGCRVEVDTNCARKPVLCSWP